MFFAPIRGKKWSNLSKPNIHSDIVISIYSTWLAIHSNTNRAMKLKGDSVVFFFFSALEGFIYEELILLIIIETLCVVSISTYMYRICFFGLWIFSLFYLILVMKILACSIHHELCNNVLSLHYYYSFYLFKFIVLCRVHMWNLSLFHIFK